MPYVPIKNGPSIWIDDAEEAKKKYEESWGFETPEVEEVRDVYDPSSRERRPETEEEWDMFRDYVRSGESTKDVPWGTARPLGRQITNVPRRIINDPVKFLQKFADTTQSATRSSWALGTVGKDSLIPSQESIDKYEKARVEAVEALEKTGRKADGSSYGVPQDFPVLGKVMSDDSDFVKDHIQPLTKAGKLTSSVLSVFGSNALVGAVLAPAKVTQVGNVRQIAPFKGFEHLWKNKGNLKVWKDGMRNSLHFLIRELVPNAVEDVVYFQPGDNPDLKEPLEAIQKLPQDQREAAMRVLVATTDSEWSHAWKQFEEVAYGAGFVVGLRSLFRAGNKVLRKSKGLIEKEGITNTLDKALDEVAPEAQKIQELQALNKAHEIREDELGKVTTELYKGIDDITRNFSGAARNVSESFLNKGIDEETAIGQLALQIQKDLAIKNKADFTEAYDRIKELEFDLVAKTPEARAKKRELYQNRLTDYEEALQNDPDWIKGKSSVNPKSPKARRTTNRTKLRNLRNNIAKLDELDELHRAVSQLDEGDAARQARLEEMKGYSDSLFTGGVTGLRKLLVQTQQELNQLDAINVKRIEMQESKNAQLIYEGKASEINPNLNLKDERGLAYLEFRKLIQEGLQQKKWDIGYVQKLVLQADDIHNKVIRSGGTAPDIMEGAEDIASSSKGPKAIDTTPPKLTIEEVSKAKQGFEEIERALEQGVDESIENLSIAASEEFGIPADEIYAAFKGPRAEDMLKRLIDGSPFKKYEEGEKLIPPREAPIKNEVPMKADAEGNPKIDTETINKRRAVNNPPPPKQDNIDIKTKKLNKDNRQFTLPKTEPQIKQAANDLVARIVKTTNDAKHDKLHGTDFLDKDSTWYNTSTLKYAPTIDQAAVIKAAVDVLGERGFNANRYALTRATQVLIDLAGNPQILDQIINAGEKYSEEVKEGLFMIPVLTSLFDSQSANLLKATRDLRNYQDLSKQGDVGSGWDERALLKNFKDRYKTLFSTVKVVSQLFEGFGNGLRLFQKQNRLAYIEGQPNPTMKAFADFTKRWGDKSKFYEELATASKKASEEIETQFEDFFKLVEDDAPIPPEKWEGINNLVQRVYEAKGDLLKLKQLDVTGPQLLRRVQSGGMISNPATIVSIPTQAIPDSLLREGMYTGASYLNAGTARWITKNLDGYEKAIMKARMHQETILNLRFTFGEALDSSLNRFLYGKSIADPGTSNRAWEINSAGLLREDEITSDLKAAEFNLPFINYVLKKSPEEQDVLFDTLNKARVFTKVFHDYAIAGEAWGKRSWFSKWLLAPTTSAAQKLGFGKTSYYSNGQQVNLTLPFQLSALGDEFNSAWWGNARARALAEIKVDEDIAAGLIDIKDRADQLKLYINKSNEELYRPITAGLDNEVIGYEILDEQIKEMTRAVNLTEELEGNYKGVGDLINSARYNEDHPTLSAFANTMAGVVTSPLNGIKWGIRWGTGIDIYQVGVDGLRMGAKKLTDHLPEALQKSVTQNAAFQKHIKDFESKYFSKDLNTRVKAQGALAIATGIHSTIFFQLRDPNQEISGGLENTYREEKGQVGLFTMLIQTPWGPWRMPYRWIPIYGQAMAYQATMRDIEQFGMTKGAGNLMGAVAAATANYILETPGLASVERIIKAVQSAAEGNFDRLGKFASQAFAASGDPYLQFRKFVTQGLDPRKPADTWSKYQTQQFWEEDPDYTGPSGTAAAAYVTNMATDTFGSLMGYTNEYSAVGFITDEIVSIVKKHPEGKSRRALYYGKPGETINASHAGKWYPIQGALGRYWLFPDKLDDEVKSEMVVNLIQPPKQNLYAKDGIRGVNKTVLNDFNHFLNSEFQYYDPITKKDYVGMHAALKDLINSKYYQSLPKLDSPYATGGYRILPGIPVPFGPEQPDWDRSKNVRRTYLSNYVRTLITKAKEDFMLGEQEGQQYKAPEKLKQAILSNRRGGNK